MSGHKTLRLAGAIVALGLVAAGSAHAASSTWDVGTGSWTTASDWSSGTAPGLTSGDSPDIATFGYITGTTVVTVDATRYIGGITFANTGSHTYTLSGGGLYLNSGGTIQTLAVEGAHTDTIGTPIQIDGTSGATAFFTSGGTAGTAILSIGAVTGAATSGNTTTLTLNGGNIGANAVTGIIGNGGSGGNLAIVKSGTGLWTLSGTNTFSGGVTLNSGTLKLSNTSALGSGTLTISGGSLDSGSANLVLSTNNAQNWNNDFTFIGTNSLNLGNGAVTLGSGRTVTVATNTLTVGGNIGDGGHGYGLTKAGTGTLLLSGSNSYTGVTTVNAGILEASTTAALPYYASAGSLSVASSATLVVAVGGGGQWQSGNIGSLLGNTTAFATGSALGIDTTGGSFTYSSAITNSGMGLTVLGSNTLTLMGTNTYTGVTKVSAGILEASTTAAVPYYASAGSLSVASGATFAVPVGSGQWQPGNISSLLSNTTAFASGSALGIDTTSGSFTYSGAITNSGMGLTVLGSNTLTLTGSNTYTGSTTISAGTLAIGGAGSLGASGSYGKAITIASGALLYYNSNAAQTFSGAISGSGALTEAGPGMLTLSKATNTYTGLTTISGGMLLDTGNGVPFALTVSSGTYDLTAPNTLTAVALSSGLIEGSGTLTGTSFTVSGGTISAPLAGAAATLTATAGTTFLSGANLYKGGQTSAAARCKRAMPWPWAPRVTG